MSETEFQVVFMLQSSYNEEQNGINDWESIR